MDTNNEPEEANRGLCKLAQEIERGIDIKPKRNISRPKSE